ncbi:hypothetical protein SS50377_22008 [Spironucleus salmonicida]|uniref:Uncharacterized protein n=1 Tax=Spironucleus salmonicida TaxID=348837 RepID=V6LMA9_9EUKA|nr:hypothetical protein SS50377_22008 [Spironucleus salmonicida]|eukprot:EST45827.1 Hypothetical protein SS50377_14402 [Spironucleus salmonicida]
MLSVKHKALISNALQSNSPSKITQALNFINKTKDPHLILNNLKTISIENEQLQLQLTESQDSREILDEINSDLHKKLSSQQREIQDLSKEIGLRASDLRLQIGLREEVKEIRIKIVDKDVLINQQKTVINSLNQRLLSVMAEKQHIENLLRLTQESQKSIQEVFDKVNFQSMDQEKMIQRLQGSLESSINHNNQMNDVVNKLILTLTDNDDIISRLRYSNGGLENQFQAVMQGLLNIQCTNNQQEKIMKIQQVETVRARNELFKQQVEFGQVSDVIMQEIKNADHNIFLLKRQIDGLQVQNQTQLLIIESQKLESKQSINDISDKSNIIQVLSTKLTKLQEQQFDQDKLLALQTAQSQKYKEEIMLFKTQNLSSNRNLEIENKNLKYQLARYQKIQDKLRGRIDDLSCLQSMNELDNVSKTDMTFNIEENNEPVVDLQNNTNSKLNSILDNQSQDIGFQTPRLMLEENQSYSIPENTDTITGQPHSNRVSQIQQFISPNVQIPQIPKPRLQVEKQQFAVSTLQSDQQISEQEEYQSINQQIKNIENQLESTQGEVEVVEGLRTQQIQNISQQSIPDLLNIENSRQANFYQQSTVDETILSDNQKNQQLDMNMVNSQYNIDEPSMLDVGKKSIGEFDKFLRKESNIQLEKKQSQQRVNPFEQESNIDATLLEQEYYSRLNQIQIPDTSSLSPNSVDVSYNQNNYNNDISYVEGVFIPKMEKTGAIRDPQPLQEEQPEQNEFFKQQAQLRELRKQGFQVK